jgi:hypothetical protein
MLEAIPAALIHYPSPVAVRTPPTTTTSSNVSSRVFSTFPAEIPWSTTTFRSHRVNIFFRCFWNVLRWKLQPTPAADEQPRRNAQPCSIFSSSPSADESDVCEYGSQHALQCFARIVFPGFIQIFCKI